MRRKALICVAQCDGAGSPISSFLMERSAGGFVHPAPFRDVGWSGLWWPPKLRLSALRGQDGTRRVGFRLARLEPCRGNIPPIEGARLSMDDRALAQDRDLGEICVWPVSSLPPYYRIPPQWATMRPTGAKGRRKIIE